MSSKNTKLSMIRIPRDLRNKLKAKAAIQDKTLMEFIVEILKKYLATLCVLIMFIGCGTTTTYVQVDPVNKKRFEHDQKMSMGLSMKTIMDRFGSPGQSHMVGYGTGTAIRWIYYSNIACNSLMCTVYFDPIDKVVVGHDNWRIEFNNQVQYED